ncbi:hypothetical protein C5167_047605 [Papaver somniferum]|uniref:RING-type E3 ubiquitin transferase n=1 Tax=Papaver somniferum TaxID=3469 RepID=A0A4Y7LIP9_PAPSO|nr:putative RING-H2 finger protein ATL21A [Papaver somniferum]RZC84827.1 hypothetical protein C5167_047605 [Papaver somniferum]
MGASIIIFLFFLFCFLCLPHFIVSSSGNCLNNQCSKEAPGIAFPFRLKGRQAERCGYPGYDLTCDNMNRTILELPFSGRFVVKDIKYGGTDHEILLHDPDDFLPRRLLNQLNLSGTPFIGYKYQNYSFFSCRSDTLSSSFDSGRDISCLSNTAHKVFATSSIGYGRLWSNVNCTLIATIQVPVKFISNAYDDYPRFYYETVLELTWNWKKPWCKKNCDDKDSNFPSYGGRLDVLSGGKTFPIAIGIIIPTVIVVAICYIVSRIRGFCFGAGNIESTNSSQLVTITTGLDEFAIQSFPTIVLGESGRLPDPANNICVICLSEYQPKEKVKILPSCSHCFHSACINDWLHLNSTCPVCRISPVL